MIIVKLIGGLGNQLFQYALGRNLALKNDTELKLDISGFEIYKLHNYGLYHFNIIENIAKDEEIQCFKRTRKQVFSYTIDKISKRFFPWYKRKYITEPDFSYNSNIFKITKNAYLEGYWQSEKYFTDISETIRKEISVKNEPDELNRNTLTQINITNSVSLHIRRGDYISNKKSMETHGVPGMDYYMQAQALIEEKIKNPHIFVFSDDIEWTRNHLKSDLPLHFIDHNGVKKNYEDMRLISFCKHHIIANSSFSWWGAWLSNNPQKIVIAPKKWFNKPDINTKDLIPEYWIRL
jgi:hypothetical protein